MSTTIYWIDNVGMGKWDTPVGFLIRLTHSFFNVLRFFHCSVYCFHIKLIDLVEGSRY